MLGVLRDFLVWQNFTPGPVTTGGTVAGSVVNPAQSIGGVLAIDPVSGNITLTLPAPPAGTTGWAVVLKATVEGISPAAVPSQVQPMYTSFAFVSSTGTVNFNDSDWGNFIALSSGSQTVTTEARLACLPGTVIYTINTAAIMTINSAQQSTNRKLHFTVDAVAY